MLQGNTYWEHKMKKLSNLKNFNFMTLNVSIIPVIKMQYIALEA